MSYSNHLRHLLSQLNFEYAKQQNLRVHESRGSVILYEPSGEAHGNFFGPSYKAILENPKWRARLSKAHTAKKNLPLRDEGSWCELDSSCSSDALLMNVFCYQKTRSESRVLSLLGLADPTDPIFGYKAKVPLKGGKFDRTEVDMRVGDLLVEAKLTEGDFQTKPITLMERYRHFSDVFDKRLLPKARNKYRSYQLIRNVLCAHATGLRFCVLLDERRPDLIEQWHVVQRAIKSYELRTRCLVLTWQELSHSLPAKLREFLASKYGIE